MKLAFFIIGCLLAINSTTAKEKKISLEDIERDNLSSEKKLTRKPATNNAPLTQFGFVPFKTAGNYERQQPEQVYNQPSYVPQLPQQYVIAQQQQYVVPTTVQQQQQQYSQGKYSSSLSPKYYATLPQSGQQYYYQPQTQQQPQQYQQYENVQYVTDNSINQTPQQYYTPQYVYLQQYPASSNEVQTVVDPKGAVQYIMYVPSYVAKPQEQIATNYVENVVYTNPQTQYVAQEQPQQEYVQIPAKTPIKSFSRDEPKSLLDSYVPSILQVQYYKQQQQQQIGNSLQRDTLKLSSPISGKVDYVKTNSNNYKTPTTIQSSSAVIGGANGAESSLHYKYQLPTTSSYQRYQS